MRQVTAANAQPPKNITTAAIKPKILPKIARLPRLLSPFGFSSCTIGEASGTGSPSKEDARCSFWGEPFRSKDLIEDFSEWKNAYLFLIQESPPPITLALTKDFPLLQARPEVWQHATVRWRWQSPPVPLYCELSSDRDKFKEEFIMTKSAVLVYRDSLIVPYRENFQYSLHNFIRWCVQW